MAFPKEPTGADILHLVGWGMREDNLSLNLHPAERKVLSEALNLLGSAAGDRLESQLTEILRQWIAMKKR